MPKTALVLSGGGAKGAFQAGAEKYAREVAGYRWDVISGISVGALNGAMLAMGKYAELEEMWKTISNERVYTGKRNWWALVRMLLGAKSVHGHEPLRKLIEREISSEAIRTRLIIGAVDLISGRYLTYDTGFPTSDFRKMLLASTSIPVLFPPVRVSHARTDMVDGAIRNLTPLGDVLRHDPDEIVVINCNPRVPGWLDRSPEDALGIGERSLEIMTNEILVNDVDALLRINRMVKQAEAGGVVLRNGKGEPYKHYICTVIEPDRPMQYTLDFSRELVDRAWEEGWEKAKAVFGR